MQCVNSIYVKRPKQVHLQRQKVDEWVLGTGREVGVWREMGVYGSLWGTIKFFYT